MTYVVAEVVDDGVAVDEVVVNLSAVDGFGIRVLLLVQPTHS